MPTGAAEAAGNPRVRAEARIPVRTGNGRVEWRIAVLYQEITHRGRSSLRASCLTRSDPDLEGVDPFDVATTSTPTTI
jgi:hypothetical protein